MPQEDAKLWDHIRGNITAVHSASTDAGVHQCKFQLCQLFAMEPWQEKVMPQFLICKLGIIFIPAL